MDIKLFSLAFCGLSLASCSTEDMTKSEVNELANTQNITFDAEFLSKLPNFIDDGSFCSGSGLEMAKSGNMRYALPHFKADLATPRKAEIFSGEGQKYSEILSEYEFGALKGYGGGLYGTFTGMFWKQKIPQVEAYKLFPIKRDNPGLSHLTNEELWEFEWKKRALCLTSALNKLYKHDVAAGAKPVKHLYRGKALVQSKIDPYVAGKVKVEDAFTSTSYKKSVAHDFSGLGDDASDTSEFNNCINEKEKEGKVTNEVVEICKKAAKKQPVLFIYTIPNSKLSSGAELGNMKVFDEAEILLPPRTKMLVKSVEKKVDYSYKNKEGKDVSGDMIVINIEIQK